MEKQSSGNKDLVLEAFDTLFNKNDNARAETFWSPKYIQHSPHVEQGRIPVPSPLRHSNPHHPGTGSFHHYPGIPISLPPGGRSNFA
jgi:hypothetical protein